MTDMTGVVFSQKVIAESSDIVGVYLRDSAEAVQQKQGETVLDINHFGNWVRGFEVVGGFVPFSVAKAVAPFNPVPPAFPGAVEPRTVTYDAEADAAFFYLEYSPRLTLLTPEEQANLKAVSLSVNPTATYGLDRLGGLVWIKIPVADLSGPADQFLQLLRR
jgi:uncharacterized protein YuzE